MQYLKLEDELERIKQELIDIIAHESDWEFDGDIRGRLNPYRRAEENVKLLRKIMYLSDKHGEIDTLKSCGY